MIDLDKIKPDTVSFTKALELACAHQGKFGVYVNVDFESMDHSDKLVEDTIQTIKEKYGEIFYAHVMIAGEMAMFTTRNDAQKFYNYFTDAPFENNGVYALIISPTDGSINENT
ncbi:hypothetical protein VCHA53O466_320050 [Vibrio chagasii]|nr:hypothetical protein VCHA53O466_320050 [Vibrio chagasii]